MFEYIFAIGLGVVVAAIGVWVWWFENQEG